MNAAARPIALACALVLAAGCGREDVPLAGDLADGGPGGACQPGASECNDCEDDDGDGLVDGFDPECTGPLDRDEGSFATEIPGDNRDARKQDCFFDGDSGGSCQVDTCCLYPAGQCPIDEAALDCGFDDGCVADCQGLVPPGCDCFGCCTVCVAAGCYDVLLNPAVAPACDQDTVGTDACPTCQKIAACTGGECDADPTDCVLCPGEDSGDLPASCGGANECPVGVDACPTGRECGDTTYCQAGCCVAVVQ